MSDPTTRTDATQPEPLPGIFADVDDFFNTPPVAVPTSSLTEWLNNGTQAHAKSSIKAAHPPAFFITKELQRGTVTGVLVRGGFGWIRKGRLKNGQSVAIKVLQPRDLKVPSVEKSKVCLRFLCISMEEGS